MLSSGGGRREVSDDIPDPRTDYFKFIQVRHPLERLASAYVDKVQGYNAKTKERLIHMKVRYYLDLLLRGLVKLKQIQKSEKNSDWSDTTLPPPSIFFETFGNMKTTQKHTKKYKNSIEFLFHLTTPLSKC